MYFLISIPNESFDRVMTMRVLYRQLGVDVSATRDAPELLRRVRSSFGGRLVLLDWDAGQVMADKGIIGVSGLATRNQTVVACSWIEQCVYLLDRHGDLAAITHPWFNYIHSVDVTPDGSLLLASAGSDLIIELTANGEVAWHWFGPEHGYDACPDGSPAFFDRSADYRGMRRSTAEQAMHVTSAIFGSQRSVLATLFHQGTLVLIDRETGRTRTLLDGLHRPHGLHRHDGGFIVSDTLGHRVLLLDHQLEVCSEIPFGSQWLQDTIVTSAGTYLTLENVHIDQLPEPGLTNRLTEIDAEGRRLRGVDVGPQARLFTVREVDEGLARSLARSWGRSGYLRGWRWNLLDGRSMPRRRRSAGSHGAAFPPLFLG
jgi:hypothetical protein